VRRTTPHRWRTMLLAAGLALAALVAPVPPIEAHTCTPDPQVGVGGRLLVARDSGAIEIALPGRQIRQIPVMPAQGAATGVASAPDGGLLAVTRFWRRPEDRIGGQDILVVGADGGAPLATIERGREGDVLGVPSWLPDGSLLYERRELSGANEAVRVERARPGGAPEILADGAAWPTASPDGSLVAMTRTDRADRLVIRDIAGGAERTLVDTPRISSIAFPRFSPDGAWIAFTATSDPSLGDASLVPVPGPVLLPGRERLLSTPDRSGTRAGVRTAYAHGIPWDVWLVRPDGSDLRRATAFYDDDSSVAWSPDGRWLVTLSAEALHVIAVDSAENYCITDVGGYGSLEWLP
jgi:dipeptidyl aminopeptidase/acylaminoacyl peptidase